MPLVYALHVPNAPFLISPSAFGGIGAETVEAIQGLHVVDRYRPEVVLVASPHWQTPSGFRVDDRPRPKQIYDFSGFPPELSAVKYEPPGSPDLARALVEVGRERGLPVAASHDWGLDHGGWAPLVSAVPGATIPVVPLSITSRDPRLHLRWGEAIGEALARRPERAVFVSTGSITHSFRRMRTDPHAAWPEGERIEQEVVDLVLGGRVRDLEAFDARKWNAIEPEGDLGPLFMLLGASGTLFRPRLVATGQLHGAFGMTVLEFAPNGAPDR